MSNAERSQWCGKRFCDGYEFNALRLRCTKLGWLRRVLCLRIWKHRFYKIPNLFSSMSWKPLLSEAALELELSTRIIASAAKWPDRFPWLTILTPRATMAWLLIVSPDLTLVLAPHGVDVQLTANRYWPIYVAAQPPRYGNCIPTFLFLAGTKSKYIVTW